MEPDFVVLPSQVASLQRGRWVYPTDDAVFRLTGPGTLECLQGVLTNDILKPGPHALVWGALLTPKGLIITDLWVKRDGDSAWLIVPGSARESVRQLLARTFPPRLSKVVDRSKEMQVWWLIAPSLTDLSSIKGAIVPHEIAPFTAMLMTSDPADAASLEQQLRDAGWEWRGADWAAARRVLAEWPTLGREIDEKTLVQEVRFDELQGVKYDKGCFTGQETVARLHFRGHANRELRKLALGAPPTTAEIMVDGKLVGRITTWGILGEEIVALGMMRKKAEG